MIISCAFNLPNLVYILDIITLLCAINLFNFSIPIFKIARNNRFVLFREYIDRRPELLLHSYAIKRNEAINVITSTFFRVINLK